MNILISSIKTVSIIGGSPGIVALTLIVVLFFLARKDYFRTLTVILSLGSGLYSTLLKGLFGEARPLGYVSSELIKWNRYLAWETYSFPSTHVVVYTAFFGFLFYLSCSLKDINKLVRYSLRFSCAFMIVSVGASRVLLGAHYVRDVVFGYVFGLIYLSAVIAIERFWGQKQAGKLLKHKTPW